jgi:hypothetical protein
VAKREVQVFFMAKKEFPQKKIASIFIKLDISKAFDTINWSYLIAIMSHLGFGQKWRDWVAALWCTSSSTVLLNGEREKGFCIAEEFDK